MDNQELTVGQVSNKLVGDLPPQVVSADSASAPVNADSGTAAENEVVAEEVENEVVDPNATVAAPKKGDEANKRIRELAAEKKRLEQENAYLKGLAEGVTKRPDAVTDKPAEPIIPAEDVQPIAPKADTFDTFEEYETAKEQYIVDRTLWQLRQDRKKEAEEEKKKQQVTSMQEEVTRVQKNWTTQSAKAKSKYQDFDAVVSSPTFVQTGVTAFLIQDSEVAGDLAYHLATHPEEMDRLNKLQPHAAAKAIGILEKQIADSASTPKQKNIISQAPEPVSTVSGGAGISDNVNLQDLPIDEYVKRMNQARRKKGA